MLGGYLRILGAHHVQLCYTLSIYVSYRIFVCGRYRKSRHVACCCRPWISLDIALFYEEQCQPSSDSVWPAYPKKVNRVPLMEAGGCLHNLHVHLSKIKKHIIYTPSETCFLIKNIFKNQFNVLLYIVPRCVITEIHLSVRIVT